MSPKKIFSLRLNEDIRKRLIEVADAQGTTATALINRYILNGLAKDGELMTAVVESEDSVTQPQRAALGDGDKLEELLFQVLQNQRHIINTCDAIVTQKSK
ncbi:MAG: hypothetical protein AAGD09_07315 [Cyanobacteria bacterium P01_F01_bin.56]